jgi:hypothetical protein
MAAVLPELKQTGPKWKKKKLWLSVRYISELHILKLSKRPAAFAENVRF